MIIGISDQMGAQFDRLRCEVCQNLILSPINTGLLRYAVATVLTVYGIETCNGSLLIMSISLKLQQYLPFTVLKRHRLSHEPTYQYVATVLTVYGIETGHFFVSEQSVTMLQQYLPFTVLKL